MEPIDNTETQDLPDDDLTDKDLLDRYKMEIQLYDKEYKTWETRSQKIIKRYKDERAATQTNPTRFNILYSNVQTLFPAAYSRNPKPDIQRRFKDDDVLGRVTSDVLERCTSYQVNEKFGDVVKHCLQDRLLPGRGVSWIRYEPTYRDLPSPEITDVAYEPMQEVVYEEVCHDYVYWKDFFHNVARIWDEVYVGGRRVYLTKQELIDRFGKKKAALCPMDYSPRGLSDEKKNEVLKKSTIYECWDKNKKKVYWLHKDVDEFLDAQPDPLDLPEFFPFPKPLLSIVTNDSLVPVPDYIEYQDQAMELDELTSRISQITKSIKVVGVYDASAAGVERMLNEGVENRLIAVESWAVFGEKGGLKGAIEFMPIKDLADVLMTLYESREKVKNDLYEVCGISDIIRGATKASETATAQTLKSKYANIRLDVIQNSVARFARDMVVNTSLIIAKHFSLDTIKAISGVQLMTAQEKQQFMQQQQQAQMAQQQWQQIAQQAKATGQQPPPQPTPPPPIDDKTQELLDDPTWEEVYQLLQNQPELNFKIDIETDSTVKADEDQDKQDRMQFLTAAGTFIQQASQNPIPEMMPLYIQMLMFGIRGFPVAKSIEGAFRTILKKVEKEAANPKPPKPDPAMAKIQADQQAQQAKMQADQQMAQLKMQSDKQDAQNDMALEQNKMAQQAQLEEKKIQMQIMLARETQAAQAQQNAQETQNEMQLAREKMAGELALKEKLGMMQLAIQAQGKEAPEETGGGEDNMKPLVDTLKSFVEAHNRPKTVTMKKSDGTTLVADVQ